MATKHKAILKCSRVALCILCLLQFVYAQHEYLLQHYTQQNGLPQNSITDLIWDQNHLLWITTEDGLVRFNGNQFNTFNQTNSSCIKNDRFKWILKDALGNLNACDAEGNVYPILNYSPTQCKFMYTYRYLSGYFPDTATLQVILNHPTFKRKGSNLVIFQCKTKNQLYVKQLNTIYTVRNNSFIDSLILPPKTVDCFSLNGNIYIYSKDTLYNLNLDNKSVKKVNLPIRFRISENNKFYAQNGNQSVILKQGKQLFVLTTKNSSTEMNITHQAIVKGNLEGYLQKVLFDSIINTYAISTNLNGLYILRPSYFKTQSNNKIDEQNEGFYAQLRWDDSSVLTSFGEIISNNAWLSQIRFRFKQINKKAFLKDDDGYFWMLRHDSVLIADSWWKNVVAIPTGGIHAVGTFAKWKTDVLLITEQEIMLFSKRKLKRKIPLLRAAQEKSGDIAVLIENNTLYLGLKNGLYKYDLSKMKIESAYPCYNSRFITRVGRMILCTTYGNGLFAMVNDSLIPLPLDNYGYLSKAHNAVVVDSTGFILFATNNGFFTTYSSEIENYINLKSNSIYYQYFDRQDGILNTEFNGGCYPSFNILQPDLVSFSNMLGIVFVKPSKLKLAPLPNLHYVNSVRIDGMLLNVNQDSISVPSSFNSLSLTIGSAYWNNPTNIQIAYRLNESTVWNALERHDNAIVFTHLNAGNNLIQIQIRTGFNLYHTLNITVYREPAFFEQVWFKICVIVLGILLLLLIGYLYNNRLVKYNAVLEAKVEARTQQLKDMNMFLEKSKQELQQSVNVKNKLISIISHDIVTPIKFISMVSKNYNKKEHPDNENEIIREINHTSQRLFDNAQNILNWVRYQNSLIKVQQVNVSPFVIVEEIRELLFDVAAMRKNQIENLVEMDDIVYTDRTILSIIIQNIVSNAVKYTQNNTIQIKSFWKNSRYVIIVTDQGPGISANNLYRIEAIKHKMKTSSFNESADGTGLGYVIIFELADLIKAEIDIESSPKGTIVSIMI